MPTVSAEISPAAQRETRTRLAFDFPSLVGRVLFVACACPAERSDAACIKTSTRPALTPFTKLTSTLTQLIRSLTS